MLLKGLFLALLVLGGHCQLQHSLHHSINNMIGGPVGVDHLVTFAAVHGQYHPVNTDTNGIHGQFGAVVHVPHVGWNVNPFAKFRPLLFGNNAKVSTLTYHTQITAGGSGYVVSNALLGVRAGAGIQMISAYGVVIVHAKQQFTVQTIRKCKKILFVNKCHNENINVPRGFHNHEIEAIIQEAQRRAAVAMRQSLGLGSEQQAPLALSSPFHDEHHRLRTLYPEIQYDYEDYNEVDIGNWNHAIYAGMLGMGDQGARDRIYQFIATTGHSNFLWAVDGTHLFYLIIHNNGNGTFNLHVSHFIVGGGARLPAGAFATSTGGWSLERGGEGAAPSIHQVLAIFGYK